MSPLYAASTGLPPAPRGLNTTADTPLFLELVVNDQPGGKVVPVVSRDGHFYVALPDLAALHIPAGIKLNLVDLRVAVDVLPGVKCTYAEQTQQLLLTVPPDWLPQQHVGDAHPYDRMPGHSSLGALLNYDTYVSKPDVGSGSLSAWHELRVFGEQGVLSSTGTYHRAFAGSSQSPDGYTRYDTTLTHYNENSMLTWQFGDLVTNSLPWSSTVRLGGMQVARDFSIRPDVVTYPLPQFAGEAAVPSAVDLFINGYKASSAQLQPGPFTLTNVPYINGAGEAVVVTTDALGRQVSTTVPFYVATTLLQPGQTDFSVAAGGLRLDYGLKSFAYGDPAASATYRRGISNNLTLEAHCEAAPSFVLGGAGFALKLDDAGVLNFAASSSHLDGKNGQQFSAGYQYNNRRFSFNFQRIQRTRGFGDLSTYDILLNAFSRSSSQVTGNVSLDRFGNLGAGYFDVEAADGSRTRLVNLSWSIGLWGASSLYVSANHDLVSKNWSGAVQLVVPLDTLGTVTTGMQRSADQGDVQQVNYSRAVPSEGGLGWTLNYSRSDSAASYRQADLTWRNRYLQMQGGIYGSSTNYTRWGELTGAVVVMDDHFFLTDKINEAFVLVSTDGQSGIPVRYENQFVGNTDSGGHLLVPWTTSWYPARYEIDPLNLPADYETPTVEQRVAVKANSGYLLEFPIRPIVAATLTLVDGTGQPLPMGTKATLVTGDNKVAYVGWDGKVYFEGLHNENQVRVELNDEQFCNVSFPINAQKAQITRIGPLTCVAAAAH